MQTKFFKPLLVAISLMSASQHVTAQTYIAATINDITAGLADAPQNVNCDHAEYVYSTKAYNYSTVVWDNYPTSGSPSVTVFINFRGFSSGTGGNVNFSTTIAGATRPDAIIGSDASGQFYLGVVYELSGQVLYNEYNITSTYTGTAAATVSLSTTPTTYTLSAAGEWPHIDGFVAGSSLSSADCYAVPKFAMSWQENPGTGTIVKAAQGSFASGTAPATVSGLNFLLNNVLQSDISAYVADDGRLMANLIYTRTNVCSGTELWVESQDVYSTTASTAVILETSASLRAPRIESQGWHPKGNGNAAWIAVCPKLNTATSKYDPIEYDEASTGAVQNVMPGFANTYECTAISGSCGIPITSGALAVTPFNWVAYQGMMMYGTGTAKLKFGFMQSKGGTGTLYGTAYGPNKTNELPPYTGFPVAAASSSSSGHNMLVAFGTHTSVSYKLIYDTMSIIHFRPEGETGIDETTKEVDDISVYANPTTNNIMLKDIDHGTYIIYDVSGKKMASGNVEQGHSIYTENLAAGTYYIELNEDNKVSKLPFIKQ